MIIKSVLQSWKTWDSYLSSICTPADPAASSSKRGCGPPFPTAGLVGFLSHSASQNVWEDAYRCVNASINHGTNLTRGFKFEGRNAGALWPVGKQGQNQRYRFANHRFTLVALVSIHKVPRSTRPLVGASLDGSGYRKLLGLSYDKEQRWVPTFGRAASSPTGSWELNKTYHVVLAFEEGVGYIYVDGEPLRGSGQRLTSVQLKSMEISHFSIGSYGTSDRGTDSQITVTHVLLYNRRIEPSEVQTLFLGISKIVATSESMANEMVIQKMMLDASERGSIFSRIDTLFLLTLLLLLSIS